MFDAKQAAVYAGEVGLHLIGAALVAAWVMVGGISSAAAMGTPPPRESEVYFWYEEPEREERMYPQRE